MDGKSDFGSSLMHGLMGYWNLDETSGTRADSLGFNNLSPGNAPGYDTGVQGNCATFARGSDQSLTCNPTSRLYLGLSSYTFALWFKASSPPPAGKIGIVLMKGSDVSKDWFEYSLFMNNTRHMVARMGYANHTDVCVDVTSSSVLLYKWYFAAVWYNSDDKSMSLQLNNDQIWSATVPNSYTNILPFRLGDAPINTSDWDGYIDEVGVWNRCLSACETKSLYNSGKGTTYPFSNTGC